MAVGVDTPNDLMIVFSNTISAGFSALQGSVNGVFGLMIALVVALTGIQWALSSNRDVLAAGFGKVLLIGAFAWLINDWQRLSETIYAGFLELGLTAGGGTLSRSEFLNPGAILAAGWEIVKALGETPAPVDNPLDVVGNLADGLILGLAMIGILLAFAVLALQIIVSLVEFKIVTLGGFVLLPFGIWSKSAFLAERPLGYVVSSGLKVLALAIVVSGAQSIFDQLQPSTAPDIYEALSILVASILLAMLALFIPNLAAALVTGGPALGAGSLLAGTVAVGGAGLLAGAAVAGAGAAAATGAARISGSSRAAAGAGFGRPAAPAGTGPSGSGPSGSGPSGSRPSGGGGASRGGPQPSNDNPAPRGGRAGSSGMSEPAAAAWQGEATQETVESSVLDRLQPLSSEPGPPARPAAAIAAESRAAQADFHRAASRSAETTPRPTPHGRGAALQAFFLANTGRHLLPSAESSGVLSPNLKTEES